MGTLQSHAATVPHQYALSTRGACGCVAHSLQTTCEADPELTITSVDGVSAFDLISRRAMLERLGNVEGCLAALSFVHMFNGRPSTYVWEDADGTVRTINRGEGTEQGDALMPLLFSLGQHSGLEATHRLLRVNEKCSLTSVMSLRPSQTEREQCSSLEELVWPCSDPHGQDTHVEAEWNFLFVRLCGQQKSTFMHGDLGCPPTNRALASWVLQCSTPIS